MTYIFQLFSKKTVQQYNLQMYIKSMISARTSSIQTFDSLDFARYSDDGERQVDERVAGRNIPLMVLSNINVLEIYLNYYRPNILIQRY